MTQNQNRFRLEDILGAKVPWRLFRVLLERPYLSFSPSDLAGALETSRASVLRVLPKLVDRSLVLCANGQRYRANTEHGLVRELWCLLMLERRMNMQPTFKNAVELFFNAVEDHVELFVVFGSVARGLATTESDVDVCVVGQDIRRYRFDFLPYRFEVHRYEWQDLEKLTDLVVLDALLNGIALKGGEMLFNILKGLRSFPKEYLVYRLNKAKQFRQRAQELTGEARAYYSALAEMALAEVESVLYQGMTISKPEVPTSEKHDIAALEVELARQGDRIWLT